MDEIMYAHIQQVENNHWWYVGRRKIIFDRVLPLLAQYDTPRILDVGCGTGYNIEYMQQHGFRNIVGLDFSLEALKLCHSRGITQVVCGDGTLPPFESSSFDVITALDMIEHVEDDVRALQELARILKPGGSLVIFTPAYQFLWGLQDEISHHFRRYMARNLRAKVQQAGLTISRLTYANTFLFPVVLAGRMAMRLMGRPENVTSENDLHPPWSNGILKNIFAAESPLLNHIDFPFGVSLLCIARK
jgi:SAM-dependent methyltransferase